MRSSHKGINVEVDSRGEMLLPCSNCDYKKPCKNYLLQHMLNFHIKSRLVVCKVCDFKASNKHVLKCHVQSVHKKKTSFPCPNCIFVASDKHSLQRHITSIHKGMKFHACKQCDYKTDTPIVLLSHNHFAHGDLYKAVGLHRMWLQGNRKAHYHCPHQPCSQRIGSSYLHGVRILGLVKF